MIKALYKYYHTKAWCNKSAFKFYKRLNLAISLISVSCVATETIVGGTALNPIILGSISGAGLLPKAFSEIKDYKRKIEMCKFAYTTYKKVLVDLRAFLRGGEFNHIQFINEMRLMDETIIYLCFLTDKFEKQYNRKIHSRINFISMSYKQERIKGTEKASPIHTLFHR